MKAGHDDRTEGWHIFYAVHPEPTERPGVAETLPASTGSRVVLRPADGAPTDGLLTEAGG